jgi:ribosomal protein S12 methylthiotransferase
MRRPERRATILKKVEQLRDAIPELVLRTTVIVGFPGETDSEFVEMLHLLDEVRFERVGAFPYSVEEGTPAATMEGQVSEAEKRDRLEAVMDVQREISREKNEELIGRRETVLVDRLLEGDSEFAAEGRTRGQAIEVDGVTRLVADETAIVPGAFVEVAIEDASDYDLISRRVS